AVYRICRDKPRGRGRPRGRTDRHHAGASLRDRIAGRSVHNRLATGPGQTLAGGRRPDVRHRPRADPWANRPAAGHAGNLRLDHVRVVGAAAHGAAPGSAAVEPDGHAAVGRSDPGVRRARALQLLPWLDVWAPDTERHHRSGLRDVRGSGRVRGGLARRRLASGTPVNTHYLTVAGFATILAALVVVDALG